MAEKRGFLTSLLDRAIGKALGLPPERCNYSVSRGVEIPMRDGVRLAADVYLPLPDAGNKGEDAAAAAKQRRPTLLVQGCYGRGFVMAMMNGKFFAARGFAVLFVSCRGTFGSGGGAFEPWRAEREDARDVVAWMRAQPWYAGSFGTFGASYLGYAQWALLHDPPADCVGACVPVGPHDQALHIWGTGAFRLDRVTYADTLAHQEDPRRWFALIPPKSRLETDQRLGRSTFLSVPLLESVETYLDGKAGWVLDAMKHPDTEHAYWDAMKQYEALERVSVPVFLISGWHDTFTEQTLFQYTRLRERGCRVYLTIGPWTHAGASGIKSMPDILKFLDHHVAAKSDEALSSEPVRIYVTGADEWRSLPAWPPPAENRTFYLKGDRTLSIKFVEGDGAVDAKPCTFTFDPSDPTPTIGGPVKGGSVDDSAYAKRSDVLVYTSDALTEDLDVFGAPVLELAHSSDTPHVDVFARISEVDARGRSRNVTDVYRELDPERESGGVVTLRLRDCAHRFKKGARVRVVVAGGSFPMFARNLGSGEDRTTGTSMRAATHAIDCALGTSRVILPTPVRDG